MSVQDTQSDAVPAAAHPMDHLAPVREALLAAARRDRHERLEVAAHDASRVLEEAQAEADRLREQARAEGERDADQMRVEQRARARRRARAIVLTAQREALDELSDDVRRRLSQLWADEESGGQLRALLVEAAHADLGPDVQVADHPDGGVTATVDHARATYLLSDLADTAVSDLGDALTGLWNP